jgi:hypothetical protein
MMVVHGRMLHSTVLIVNALLIRQAVRQPLLAVVTSMSGQHQQEQPQVVVDCCKFTMLLSHALRAILIAIPK